MVPTGAGILSEQTPSWENLAGWWRDELAADPSYERDILPMALDLLDPVAGAAYLDIGCGEGRLMAEIAGRGASPIGVDISEDLLKTAAQHGPVHRAEVPPLAFLDDQAIDGAVVVLVLEHLPEEGPLFLEAARVIRPGGVLAVVANHPIWTSPGSTPVEDGDETLWRPGRYFSRGYTDEPAGDASVRFYHRPMADLLTNAASAGWSLERLVERGVTPTQVAATPALAGQAGIPRLAGMRWTRR